MSEKLQLLESILRRAGVSVEVTDDLTFPGSCEIREGKCRIRLRSDVVGDEAIHETVLAHETAHILHGDVIAASRLPSPAHVVAWNVAADQRINIHLDRPTVERIGGITPEALLPFLPTDHVPPAGAWPAQQVYDWLTQTLSPQGVGCQVGPSGGDGTPTSCDELLSDGSMSEADLAGLILRIRAGVRQHEELQELVKAGQIVAVGRGTPGQGTRRYTWTPQQHPEVTALIQAVDAQLAPLRRERSWCRRHRVEALADIMPGRYRRWGHRVMVALDVSGSTAHLLDVLGGLGTWLSQQDDIETVRVVWADEARVVEDWSSAWPDVGYGTRVQSIRSLLAEQEADVLVVATDNLIVDHHPAFSVPTVWAVAGDGPDAPYGHTVRLSSSGEGK